MTNNDDPQAPAQAIRAALAESCMHYKRCPQAPLCALEQPDASGTPRVQGLVERVKSQSESLLRAYVRKELQLPAGVEIKLNAHLLALQRSLGPSPVGREEDTYWQTVLAAADEACVRVEVEAWMTGCLSLSALLATLGAARSSSAGALEGLLLQQTGHSPPCPPRRCLSPCAVALDDVLTLTAHDDHVDLLSASGHLHSFGSSGWTTRALAGQPTLSSAALWRFDPNRHGLTQCLSADTPVLLVGGVLRHGRCELVVRAVLCADAIAMSDWVDYVLAVQGSARDSPDALSDGGTEDCAADETQSPNDSPSNTSRFLSVDRPDQVFLLRVTVWRNFAKVRSVTCLRPHMEADQRPLALLLPAPHLALLRGSHGLLLVIAEAMAPGDGDAMRVRALTFDESQHPDPSSPGPATSSPHNYAWAVTCWAWAPACELLATADQVGVLNVFKALGTADMGTHCPPFVHRDGGHVRSLQLRADGLLLAVGLVQQLLLCTVDPRGIVEAAVVDISPAPCLHACRFVDAGVEVWRAVGDCTVRLTCWTHRLHGQRASSTAVPDAPGPLLSPLDSRGHVPQAMLARKAMRIASEVLRVLPAKRISLQPVLAAATQSTDNQTALEEVRPAPSMRARGLQLLRTHFGGPCTDHFRRSALVLVALATARVAPPLALLAAVLNFSPGQLQAAIRDDLVGLVEVLSTGTVAFSARFSPLSSVLTATPLHDFWQDAARGHDLWCALFLRICGNKSVAVEYAWQAILQASGSMHLRQASRGLRALTTQVRKIDETANIRGTLPRQIGYISGLQEIYCRRVGLAGSLPEELGHLHQLRVLSLGNNRLSGPLPAALSQLRQLQRIVLHQNNLSGPVPAALGELGCIVNLAGNPLLAFGPDVPASERQALVDVFHATGGEGWSVRTNWNSSATVATWYKVGVLSSHVHSLVMSSNNMTGELPESLAQLPHLRMIELATMGGLSGAIPKGLCALTALRRLCICRCDLTGSIPAEIGQLTNLEELQLFGNRLTGHIPRTLANLTNLRLLSLGEYTGGNNFSAELLPACLRSLRQLEALFLANCHIRGPLPEWIGELSELRQLDLQRNRLSGPLPASVGQLGQLLYMNLKDNTGLCGLLPLHELCGLSKLNRLSLVHCGFAEKEVAYETLHSALPRCKIWM